eukprot:scaffold2738_cov366-Prasinococcus_capsulatus_cf.AAC.14
MEDGTFTLPPSPSSLRPSERSGQSVEARTSSGCLATEPTVNLSAYCSTRFFTKLLFGRATALVEPARVGRLAPCALKSLARKALCT